jgi:ATP-dependent helicase HepA
VPSLKQETVERGAFVKVALPPYSAYGLGKVWVVQGRQAVIRYFDVPDGPRPVEALVSLAAVRVVDLPEQTRVFRFDETSGRWQVGRVLDGDGTMVLVQFPNGQTGNFPREELQVRWRKPIADPVAFLSRRVIETPLFAQARSSFMRAVTAQRAASLGMGALLSSSIQLTDYQFNVVRRVLQDPVQRYLLADEVGLGKTIEAGILIRQYVLDAADSARVLIVVPAPLLAQWTQELAERFSLESWLGDFISVVGSDNLGLIKTKIQAAGMLVLDEAHHLSVVDAQGSNPLYEILREHVQNVPKLLLLSATPVLADTAGFLRVLHLLDPVVFPLNDQAGFERRVQSRQLVAEAVAWLVPENLLSMEGELDRLEDAFHDDNTLMRLVGTLRPIVQALPEEDDEAYLRALSQLRSHLSETYRLHRRILRNRRKSLPWATPRRSGLVTVEYTCSLTGERNGALNELRVHLFNSGDAPLVQAALFALAVHPSGATRCEDILHSRGVTDPQALALAQRVDLLTQAARSRGARLEAVKSAVGHLLRTPEQQLIVFCDRPEDADAVAQALQTDLAEGSVQRHRSGSSAEDEDETAESEEDWRAFLSDPMRCRVLVCDARAEEGLNLHGGRKLVLNFDLPPAPNRIEQRIGRLDRFGSGDAIKSAVLVCSDDRDEIAWATCLNEGLEVFTHSIASLQYLVQEAMDTATSTWLGGGADALLLWHEQLGGAAGWVARERRRIDQQDALDSLSETQDDAYEILEAVDDEWAEWRGAFDSLAIDALQFQKRMEPWDGPLPPKEQVFRLNYSRDGSRQTLLPLQSFISDFLGTIDFDARHSTSRSPLTFPYAFRRSTALCKQGRARGVKPLRYGDALVESLRRFCASDDRGRVFAMWRHLRMYESRDASGVDLYFRFDFLMEANVSPAASADEDGDVVRALGRRADHHFPPQFYTVWVSTATGADVEAPPSLCDSYRPNESVSGGGRDYNLNPNRWQVLHMRSDIPWTAEWSRHCTEAGVAAREFIERLEEVQERIRNGTRKLQAQHDARVAQLTSRAMRLDGAARDAELNELEIERETNAKIVAAVRAPKFHMDVAGAVFVSSTSPFES